MQNEVLPIILSTLKEFSWNGNSGIDLIKTLGLFVLLFFCFRIFRKIILVKISQWCARTKYHWDARISVSFQHISPWTWRFLALFFALKILILPSWAQSGANIILIVFLAIEGTRFLQNILTISLLDAQNAENKTAIHGILLFCKIVLWSTVLLLMLSNLGFNITALAASLGIGGIAIALAVQNILSDLFASFSIYFDRPFEIGDFITMGDESGEITKIGLKTTRIMTLHGEELVVSNRELTESKIHNYKKMKVRRVDVEIHFDPKNSSEKLDKVSDIAKKIVESFKGTDLNYARIMDITPWSFKFDLSYFINSADWDEHVDTKEQVLLDLKKELEKQKIHQIFLKNPGMVSKG